MRALCSWIYSKPGAIPVHRCGATVSYRMVKDDDGNLIRRYENLCPEHRKAAAAQDKAEEES